ncbi:unnamed protein product [Rotaria sp. Silwood2]|nr:unnamed protein product [Rotaria sp. Silwood2]
MLLTTLLCSISIIISAIYLYIKWKYYTLRDPVPGLKPEFLFGNLRQLGIFGPNRQLIDSYDYAAEKMQIKFGDIFQIWIGAFHSYVFNSDQIYDELHKFVRNGLV